MTTQSPIKNYALIAAESPQELVESVTRSLADGFQPIGGVSMVREPGTPGNPGKTKYAQAVIQLWARGERDGGLVINGG